VLGHKNQLVIVVPFETCFTAFSFYTAPACYCADGGETG
jgi:hypothetical protein